MTDTMDLFEPPRIALDGLAWPESPRWHDGALWFSDVHNFRVMRWVPGSEAEVVARLAGRPGGLGFMPDGRLLAATALDKKLWWIAPGEEPLLAVDLSSMVSGLLNDMIVDASGRAWVGDTGFDLLKGDAEAPGKLLSWSTREGPCVAAEDVRFPNGLAISGDGERLYLAETFGSCISAFDLSPEGRLHGRRLHAQLSGRPDGLCLDAEDNLWVALLWDNELQRIATDGSVSARIRLDGERAVSCVIAGEGRRELFLGVASVDERDKTNVRRMGSVRRMPVEVAGQGIP